MPSSPLDGGWGAAAAERTGCFDILEKEEEKEDVAGDFGDGENEVTEEALAAAGDRAEEEEVEVARAAATAALRRGRTVGGGGWGG